MEIERTDAYILVRGDFTVLSSAVFNGGLKEHVRAIVIAKVGDCLLYTSDAADE